MLGKFKDWVVGMFGAFRKEMDEEREKLRLRVKREFYDEMAEHAAKRRDEIDAELKARG